MERIIYVIIVVSLIVIAVFGGPSFIINRRTKRLNSHAKEKEIGFLNF